MADTAAPRTRVFILRLYLFDLKLRVLVQDRVDAAVI